MSFIKFEDHDPNWSYFKENQIIYASPTCGKSYLVEAAAKKGIEILDSDNFIWGPINVIDNWRQTPEQMVEVIRLILNYKKPNQLMVTNLWDGRFKQDLYGPNFVQANTDHRDMCNVYFWRDSPDMTAKIHFEKIHNVKWSKVKDTLALKPTIEDIHERIDFWHRNFLRYGSDIFRYMHVLWEDQFLIEYVEIFEDKFVYEKWQGRHYDLVSKEWNTNI